MGITPITIFFPESVAISPSSDLEPLPTEPIESSARAGDDETYSPSGEGSEEGEQDGFEQDSFEEDALVLDASGPSAEALEEPVMDPGGSWTEAESAGAVDLFA